MIPIVLSTAVVFDAPELASLYNTVNIHLSANSNGLAQQMVTEKGVLQAMRKGTILIVQYQNEILGALTLTKKKPWAIDAAYFTKAENPVYLVSMAVHPNHQRKGIGREMMQQASKIAISLGYHSIRLDAFDANYGASEFYAKCGLREVARVVYRNVPLIYFEMSL